MAVIHVRLYEQLNSYDYSQSQVIPSRSAERPVVDVWLHTGRDEGARIDCKKVSNYNKTLDYMAVLQKNVENYYF